MKSGSKKNLKNAKKNVCAEDEFMRLILGYEHLDIKDVEADQDSLFRAVCDQVNGTEEEFLQVKEKVLEFIQNNEGLVGNLTVRSNDVVNEEKWRREVRAACFVFKKNVKIFMSMGTNVAETFPSDGWIHLCLYKNGNFGSVRIYNDLNDEVPQQFSTVYESDTDRKERKEKTKVFADYLIENYGIGTKKRLTWILMRLFPHQITYDTLDDSYEKILYYLENE